MLSFSGSVVSKFVDARDQKARTRALFESDISKLMSEEGIAPLFLGMREEDKSLHVDGGPWVVICTEKYQFTLREWVKETGDRLSEAQSKEIQGLMKRMHQKHVYHGDLHADNIVVNPGPVFRFIDWQHALLLSEGHKLAGYAEMLDHETITNGAMKRYLRVKRVRHPRW